jgi:hypothetical protein
MQDKWHKIRFYRSQTRFSYPLSLVPSSRMFLKTHSTHFDRDERIGSPGRGAWPAESVESRYFHPCHNASHCLPRHLGMLTTLGQCDEGFPSCSNCSRRGDTCERQELGPTRNGQQHRPLPNTGTTNQFPKAVGLPEVKGSAGVVNLSHMKLFHHFQTHTIPTLVFSSSVWEHVLTLSFEFESLMHAILCVSARHLAVLHPNESSYHTVAAGHLSYTLQLFRQDLSSSFSANNIDVFMGTAVLLHYEMWANTDFLLPPAETVSPVAFAPPMDRLFELSSSLRGVFLNSFPHISERPSVFISHIRHSPRSVLVGEARISNEMLDQMLSFFNYRRPLIRDMLQLPRILTSTRTAPPLHLACCGLGTVELSDKDHEEEATYTLMLSRLCLLLSRLPETRDETEGKICDDLMPDLSRFVLSFPVKCHSAFVDMMRRSDPRVMLLLYHFYRAVKVLLQPESAYWWAYKRGNMLQQALRNRLQERLPQMSCSLHQDPRGQPPQSLLSI